MIKALKRKNSQLLLGLVLFAVAVTASYFLVTYNKPFRSVELGIAEHSPLGSAGGVVVPASCPSYDHLTNGPCAECPLGYAYSGDTCVWVGCPSGYTVINSTCQLNTDPPPPTTPTLAQPVMRWWCGVNGTRATFDWDPVAGAEEYPVRYSGPAPATSNNCPAGWWSAVTGECDLDTQLGTSVNSGTITPGTLYTWWVHAKYAGTWNGASSYTGVAFKCFAQPVMNAPSCNAAGTQATLSWNGVNGTPVEYPVRYYASSVTSCPAGWWMPQAGECARDGSSALNATIPVQPGVQYVWWVQARDPSTWSGASMITQVPFTCNAATLAQPVMNAPSCNATGTQVTLTWGAVAGATAYMPRVDNLALSCGSHPSYVSGAAHTGCVSGQEYTGGNPGSDTTRTVTLNIQPGTSYRWWVHAGYANSWNGVSPSTYVDFSCTAAPTIPTAPSSMTASCGVGGTSATLSWPAVSGATYYNPRFAKPAIGSCPSGWTLLGDGATCYRDGYTGTSVVVPILPNTTYDAWVQSGNTAGVSTEATHVPGNAFSCAAATPAPTCTITANPTSGASGAGVTLTVSSTNATSATLNGSPIGTSGSLVVYPTANTTYTMNVTGAGGSGSCSATYTVSAVAAPQNLSSSCPAPGTQASFSWGAVAGATNYWFRTYGVSQAECQAKPGWQWLAAGGTNYCYPNPDTAPNVTTQSGFPTLPGSTYNWVVSASNASGTVSPPTYSTVSCPAIVPPVLNAPSCGANGTQITFSWNPIPGANQYWFRTWGVSQTECQAKPGWQWLSAGGINYCYPNPDVGPNATSVTFPSVAGVTYNWLVYGSYTDGGGNYAWGTDARSVITCAATATSCTLTPSSATASYGASLPITKASTNAVSATFNGVATSTSGTTGVISIADTTYTMNVTSSSGSTASCSAVVTVPPPPTNVAASCVDNQLTVTWSAPAGYTHFYLRGSQAGINYSPLWVEDYVVTTSPGTRTVVVDPTLTYTIWVHSRAANGAWSNSTYAPTTVTCPGSIMVKRIGSDLTTTTAPAGTYTALDNNTSTWYPNNPYTFTGVASGAHTVFVTDIPGYTEMVGTCSYPSGGTECSVTTFPTAPTCGSSQCWVATNATQGQTTKVAVQYLSGGGAPTVACSLPSVTPGGTITGTITGGVSMSDWVSIYTPGTPTANYGMTGAVRAFEFVPLPRPATVSFTAPTTVGSYEMRLQLAGDPFTTVSTCSFTVANATCTPDPSSPQTQTLACPAGQTGSITQQRTSTCAQGATSPTWSAWTTTFNACSGVTTGEVLIKRVDSGLNTLTSPATSANIDTTSGATTANPATFSSIAAGPHTAYVTDVALYTEKIGTCSYPSGGTECLVSAFPTTPTCSAGFCSTPITVVAGQTTKVVAQYTGATGDIMVKRVDETLNTITGTTATVGGSSSGSNPATFSGLSTTGTQTISFSNPSGDIISVGTCTYPIGGVECTVSTFPTVSTCAGATCSIPAVAVIAGQTIKVVARYLPVTQATVNIYVPSPGVIRVNAGDLVTIAWDITNAAGWSCTVAGPGLSQNITASGSTQQIILGQSTYTLTCTPPVGSTGLTTQTSTLNISIIPTGVEPTPP